MDAEHREDSKMTETMNALVVGERGGPEVFELREVEIPETRPNQVRIRVRAAALNYSDLQIAGGFYPGHVSTKLPYVAGREAAGTVEAVGEGVQGVSEGDAVMSLGVRGAFAEQAICPAGVLLPIPESMSFEQAAGFQLAHLSAVAAVETSGRLQAGETILIHAAAGGVGQVMVKLAKHLGATVFATASTAEKLAVAAALGADRCINYVEKDFRPAVLEATETRGVDVAVDTVGGDVLRRTLDVMRPYGRLVIAGNASNSPVTFSHYDLLSEYRCSLIGLELGTMILQRPDLMAGVRSRFRQLVDQGVFQAQDPSVFALEDGQSALRLMAERKTIGRVVLVP